MDNNIKTIFKQAILENHTKIYSDITAYYYDKINELKPKLFIKWLMIELDLPHDSLNYGSFIMAMYRLNKRKKKEKAENMTEIEKTIKKGVTKQISSFNMPDPTSQEYIKQNQSKEGNSLKPQ